MNKTVLATISLLIATFSFGLYGVLTHYIAPNYGVFSSSYVLLAISALVVSVAFIPFRNKPLVKWIPVTKQDLGKFILVGTLAGFSNPLAYIAYTQLPIAQAYFVQFSVMMIFSYFVGKIAFKDKLIIDHYIALLFAIIGLFIIGLASSFSGNSLIGYICAFFTGVSIAGYNASSKIVTNKYHEVQVFFMVAIVSVVFSLIGALIFREALPDFSSVSANIFIVIFGLLAVLANTLLFVGYKYLDVSIAALLSPFEIVFSALSAFIILGQGINVYTLIGGIFIFIAAILPTCIDLLRTKFQHNAPKVI